MTDTSSALKDLLLATPREQSGSLASNRFDYQRDWTICKILELHQLPADYLVLCDYHEDVVILNSEEDPTLASFIQIKTRKTSNWTINSLLSQKKSETGPLLNSILGKLYSCYLRARTFTEELRFVSNAFFNFRLQNREAGLSRTGINCSELDWKEIERINTKLSLEHDIVCNLPENPVLHFEVASLSLLDHSAHVKGKIAEFLDHLAIKSQITAMYRILFDEIKRSSSYEGYIDNFHELAKRRGIGRSKIERLIQDMQATPNPDEIWNEIRERLLFEGASALKVRRLRRIWSTCEVDRMDATRDDIRELMGKIKEICKELRHADPDITLTNLETHVCSQTKDLNQNPETVFVLSLMVIYEDAELS